MNRQYLKVISLIVFFLFSCSKSNVQVSTRIAILSDLHLTNEESIEYFRTVANDMNEHIDIDKLLIIGDWATYRFKDHNSAYNVIKEIYDKDWYEMYMI